MRSIDIRYLNKLRFTSEQVASLKKLGEFKGRQQHYTDQEPESLEVLRTVALVESTESSNRIEGVIAPHKRIAAIVKGTTRPKNRSEEEIAGYRDALENIHTAHATLAFSTYTITLFHKYIHRHTNTEGGFWKTRDNKIVDKNPDNSIRRVRFIPPKAKLTDRFIEALTESHDEALHVHHKDPLIVIPLTILDFLCIHPFGDGNGRTARLLTLLLLYHHGYKVGRYISLERIIEESRETYYETLEASSQGWHDGKHDVNPWLNYFWGILTAAYRDFEERVVTVKSGKPGRPATKTEHVKLAIQRKIAPFAISDIESDCPGISRDTIKNVIQAQRDAKVLVLKGKGRGAQWIRKKDVV